MDLANYINNNGEKIEITAYDNKYLKYKERLFCPFCGELIDLCNGKVQKKHFRHHHGSYREDCENYCKAISIYRYIQPYEHEGLPLFLVKKLGTFSLDLGLYGLEENTILEAESMNLELEINIDEDLKVVREINSKYFAPYKMSFINIKTVKHQYYMKFSKESIPNEIKKKWTLHINGIGTNGAIFYNGNNGGKKVSSSTGLKVNEEYLLFTKNNISSKYINGISFEMIQSVSFGWLNNYKIIKFNIKEINRETIEFCNMFDMELKFSKPEIIPIWPPCATMEQELIYEFDSTKYFILNTDNKKEQDVYSHIIQEKLYRENIDDGKSLVKSYAKSDDFISIGSLQNHFVFSIIKRNGTKTINNVDIQIEVKSGKLLINTNTKLFVNFFRYDILLKSSIVNKGFVNDLEFRKYEKIEVLYGLDIIWTIEDLLKDNKSDILDLELLARIKKCKGMCVNTPDYFKWMVLKHKKCKQSYNELKKLIDKNQVSLELLNLLKVH